MKKIFNKLLNIVWGTYNNIFNKNNDIAYPRLQICENCKDKQYVLMMGFICSHCGCILKSKTTIPDEKCPLNKW